MSEFSELAHEYLQVIDVTAICIVEGDEGCIFRRTDRPPLGCSAHWASNRHARPIQRHARRLAGKHPDKQTAERSLQVAASAQGARLTPHIVVMSRAMFTAKRLKAYMDKLQSSGKLADFNTAYKRRRMEATAKGKGFMTYTTALMRLRRLLIVMLIERRPLEMPLFDQVFRATKCDPGS